MGYVESLSTRRHLTRRCTLARKRASELGVKVLYMSHRRAKIALLLLAVAQLGGCFGGDVEYPSTWSAIERRWTGCPDLTATYHFNGDYVDSNGQGWLHAAPMGVFIDVNKIYGMVQLDFSKVTKIEVSGPRDRHIQVSVWAGEKMLEARGLAESKDFVCSRGTVSTTVGKAQYELMRSEDGALITKTKNTDCIFAFIPLCQREAKWIRWPIVRPESLNIPLQPTPAERG